MKPEFPPETITIYQLIKRPVEQFYFMSAGTTSSTNSIGIGFYSTRQEAEHQRTLEVLRCKSADEFYLFELEIPNPIVK